MFFVFFVFRDSYVLLWTFYVRFPHIRIMGMVQGEFVYSPNVFINPQNTFDSNRRPLSMVITDGTPKGDRHPAINVSVVVWASIFAIGRTLHQRENRTTHLNKYVYPSQAGKWPVMCMWTWSNRPSRDGKGSTGVRVCIPTFAFWHNIFALVHKASMMTSLMETWAAGWDRLRREV